MTTVSLTSLVRRADPDRFLGAIFAPATLREDLIVLYAFNHELARAREVASNPALTLIRLQWWREAVDGFDKKHPVADALRGMLTRGAVDQKELIALVDAREAEAEPISDVAAFLGYVRGTAGRLMRIAGGILGVQDQAGLATLEDLGTGTGIVFLIRAAPTLRNFGRDLLPQDGTTTRRLMELAYPLIAEKPPAKALAAALPAVLARRDWVRLQHGIGPRPRGLTDRLAVIAAGLRGSL